MAAKNILSQFGYEGVENSDERIVYVRYTTNDPTIPKYKRACKKLIFDLIEQRVACVGRSEKGNLTCPSININELNAINQQVKELGWV